MSRPDDPPATEPAPRARLFLALAAAGFLLTSLALVDWFPIGVRGQWTYGLYPHEDVPPRTGFLWVPVLGLLILAIATVAAWQRLAARRTRIEGIAWFLLVLLGGEIYTTGLILTSRAGAAEPCLIAWSDWAGGFFNDGRRLLQVQDPAASYPNFALQMSPHGRTHPPGPMMLCRSTLAACRDNPEAAARIETRARRIAPEVLDLPTAEAPWKGGLPIPPLQPWGRPALLLIAWGTVWCSMLVLVPLLLLGRTVLGPTAGPDALAAAALYAVVPAIAFFSPWMDLLYPLFTVSAAAMAGVALSSERRGVAILGWVLAGAFVAVGLLFTFAHLVTVAFLFFWAVLEALRSKRGVVRPVTAGALAGAAGVGLVWASVWLAWGYNAAADVLGRSLGASVDWEAILGTELPPYLPWLWGDLVEFSAFLGWPTFFLFLLSAGSSIRRWRADTATLGDSMTTAVLATILVLDLSGVSRSETGRIWLFLMPLVVVCAARLFRGGLASRLVLLGAVAAQGVLFKLTLTTNNLIN